MQGVLGRSLAALQANPTRQFSLRLETAVRLSLPFLPAVFEPKNGSW